MKRRIRNILFATFTLLFLLAGGYLTLVAQGFVVDFEKLKIEKTGAVFIKFEPRDAVLFINGEETDHEQSGFLGSSGVVVKNLIPDEYRFLLVKEGYHEWEKTFEVRSGLITSASEVRLWPKEPATETIIESGVEDFWLTGKGTVYKKKVGGLDFEGFMIRGGMVHESGAGSKLLVTRDGTDYFLVDLENPRSAVNVNHLFNSLKQRQLALPGIVPVTDVILHPFSPNKIIVASRTSLYAIDLKKVEIEILVTLDNLKSVKLGVNDAFVLDGDDNITIINLLLKTSLGGKIRMGTVEDFEISPDGNLIFALDSAGELSVHRRSADKTELLASGIREFEVSPRGKRIVAITKNNEMKIVYFEEFKGDVRHEAGAVSEIPAELENPEKASWLSFSPNYVILLNGKKLIIQEIDEREPVNSHVLFEEIIDYEINGKKIYVLEEDGKLSVHGVN